MPTTRAKFVERCEDIVKAQPKYVLGQSTTKECDCIGMVKYGLRKNGVTLTTTGTNWTIRNQVNNIRKITSVSVLRVGDVVFKARNPGDSGYNLPAKYKKGNSAYNGDLTDYCHIGVVKSVKPLKIIHMTGPTAKTDTSIGKWKVAADLNKNYISDAGSDTSTVQPTPTQPVEPTPVVTTEQARVYAPSGRYVKMRKEPSSKCNVYDEIVIGATVTVVAHGYEWTKVNYGHRKGWYMMTKFLQTI